MVSVTSFLVLGVRPADALLVGNHALICGGSVSAVLEGYIRAEVNDQFALAVHAGREGSNFFLL